MKKIFATLLLCNILLNGCNNGEDEPITDIEVARAFITDLHENKFKEAERFVLKESTNQQYFDSFQEFFKRKSKEELEKYKAADILINEIVNVNDSVTIINYSNSYKKEEKNKLKVVKSNGKWLVDLKYTFSGNM